MKFDIGIPKTESENKEKALAYITVNDYHEQFEITLNYWDQKKYKKKWIESLSKLVNGANSVALMAWMSSPDVKDNKRAWIL